MNAVEPVQRPQQMLLDSAIAETQALQVCTELMVILQTYIEQQGWTADQAARALRQTLPRMQNLMNGEISRFTVEQLIQLLALIGLDVRIAIADQLRNRPGSP